MTFLLVSIDDKRLDDILAQIVGEDFGVLLHFLCILPFLIFLFTQIF